MGRKLGILHPISALDSPYGIGSLGKPAKNFVDFLVKTGAKCWQILPIGPTGYGDSPYQSFSCFAGNPYFIDLDILKTQKLLTAAEVNAAKVDGNLIDYGQLYETREATLRLAYQKFLKNLPDDFYQFCEQETNWLSDYAMFMVAKEENNGKPYTEWEPGLAKHEPLFMGEFWRSRQTEINFYRFCQYVFYKQWFNLKEYANSKGVELIGDIPIYVSSDSVEAWATPKLLLMGDDLNPSVVAGCPPDYFSKTGQLWGNPIYDWEQHKADGYSWWINRIKKVLTIYDTVRIDHFRAFDTYYTIPYGSKNAMQGEWREGPGREFFDRLFENISKPSIIAEDLGDLFDSVRDLLKYTGFPGMKIIQFAYDTVDSSYLPHYHEQNVVIYTGTHDNATLMQFIKSAPKSTRTRIAEYFGCEDNNEALYNSLIRAAIASVANLVIIPIGDFLRMGSEGRINTPSTLGGNWQLIVKNDCLTKELAKEINKLVKRYAR